MADKGEDDPILGFHITDYDETVQALTIAVDEMLFRHVGAEKAMIEKAIKIMTEGAGVQKVIFVPRL